MGNQHNTWVVNKSDAEVMVVVKAPGGDSSFFLQPSGKKSFATEHGNQTLSVFEKGSDGKFFTTATVSKTDATDRSFIIKKENNRIAIVASKYGDINTEETGNR